MKAEDRRRYLSIAARHARGGSGSGDSLLRERGAAYGSPDLGFLERRVRFVIVGGLATRLYMPERMTLDTDILVRQGDRPDAESALREAGGAREGPPAIGGSTWRMKMVPAPGSNRGEAPARPVFIRRGTGILPVIHGRDARDRA